MTYLAPNLRWFMRTNDLTEAQAAAAVGVSQPTINRIINPGSVQRIQNPSQRVIQKIAEGMGVSTDDLLTRDLEHQGPSRRIMDDGIDPDRLGIALVSVEKAVRAIGLNPEGLWGKLAPIIGYAYLKQSQYTELHTREGRERFDEVVELKMRAEGYGRYGRDEGYAAGGDEAGHGAAAPAPRARSGR